MAELTRKMGAYAAFFGLVIMSMISGARSSKASPLDGQLLAAAEQGDVEAVRRALQKGALIDVRDDRRRTPLMAAVQNNHVAVARSLAQ
jgi:uncharacterized protein